MGPTFFFRRRDIDGQGRNGVDDTEGTVVIGRDDILGAFEKDNTGTNNYYCGS